MWVTTVPHDQAEGDLADSYDRQAQGLGEVTEMTLAGSLHPPLVAARLDLYDLAGLHVRARLLSTGCRA